MLDLTRFVSGCICTQILADMGAETIKVERQEGDPARHNAPVIGDIGGYFPGLNRNKKGITLNLRKEKGKDLFRRLILWCDILVENFSAGTMERLGFPYSAVRALNPRVIMVSISGFGQTGPYAHRPAFDTVGQALSGIMSITGFADREPVYSGAPIADLISGYFGTIGALLALHHQQATGRGQYVESTLVESLLVTMSPNVVLEARGCGRQRGSLPNAPSGTFETGDGAYIVIMAHDDNHWPRMARIMGKAELTADQRYHSRAARAQHKNELNELVEAWARTKPADEVEKILDAEGIPFSRVQTVKEVLRDPHYRAREMTVEMDHYGSEVIPLVAPYPRLSATPGSVRSVCPHLGQHNEEVYGSLLGISRDELAALKAEGVV
ncbi:MAG: CoA transferase [Chloroflexi bacterium]|nr:CoA transferase [Chloroflexota bacterium]